MRRSLVIFIIKGFRTIAFIFIVISTTFRPICPLAFYRCLSNSGTFTELRTTSFIESTGVACSDSVSHNRVQVLSIPALLLACSQGWICNLQMIASLEGSRVWQTPEEGQRIYRPKRCVNNNKDEGNSPKTLNDKKGLQTKWNRCIVVQRIPKKGNFNHCWLKIRRNALKLIVSTGTIQHGSRSKNVMEENLRISKWKYFIKAYYRVRRVIHWELFKVVVVVVVVVVVYAQSLRGPREWKIL